MEFRDLGKQYLCLKEEIDKGIQAVLGESHYIMGKQVKELENVLADYVGVKHCISCANGTDALQLALMAWEVGEGDAVFVPDFTFFSSGEVVSILGATPIFVDVNKDTYNINTHSLEAMVKKIVAEGRLKPKAIITVDLFGQPAEYDAVRKIADQYGMYILEDSAQGFGGRIEETMAGTLGDIATTSFFPAKPLGCYGDGGAIFTNNDEWAVLLQSLRIHGKGASKYDNIHIGMNSRLDTLQAAVLLAKFPIFRDKELDESNKLAQYYTEELKTHVVTPVVKEGYYSSWAQYTIQLRNRKERDGLQEYLKNKGVPTAIYYQKPMHQQKAFKSYSYDNQDYKNTIWISERVLSLPFHPYMDDKDAKTIVLAIKSYLEK